MSNTIELLEAIGRDASLRHASGDILAQSLEAADASEGLKMAVASGDRSHLVQELGGNDHKVNHNVHDGGCDPGEGDGEDEPGQDGDEKEDPATPDLQA